jgi:hypothetical protein
MNDKNICTAFKNISHSVWNSIEKTKNQNRHPKEEAITEEHVFSNLFELPQSKVKTIEYNKHIEGIEGADWEWVFIGKNKTTFSIRVQAKVIDPYKAQFKELHYETNNRGFQSNLLISQAKINNALPLYCLYSHFEADTAPSLWGCSSHENSHKNFGCGLIDAFEVQRLRAKGGMRKLSDLTPNLVPWHCTVCCSMDNSLSLPERVRQYWAVKLGIEASPKSKKDKRTDRNELKEFIFDSSTSNRIAVDIKGGDSTQVELSQKFLPRVMAEPTVRIQRLINGEQINLQQEDLATGLRATTLFFEN